MISEINGKYLSCLAMNMHMHRAMPWVARLPKLALMNRIDQDTVLFVQCIHNSSAPSTMDLVQVEVQQTSPELFYFTIK